jgi:hypothetical protein
MVYAQLWLRSLPLSFPHCCRCHHQYKIFDNAAKLGLFLVFLTWFSHNSARASYSLCFFIFAAVDASTFVVGKIALLGGGVVKHGHCFCGKHGLHTAVALCTLSLSLSLSPIVIDAIIGTRSLTMQRSWVYSSCF